jgi:hypothetical protein
MSSLSLAIDAAFFEEMAQRFPRVAYSNTARRDGIDPLLSPKEWLASVCPAGPDARLVAEALGAQLGSVRDASDTAPSIRSLALTIFGARVAGKDVESIVADVGAWALGSDQSVQAVFDLIPEDVRVAADAVIDACWAKHGWSNTVAIQLVSEAMNGKEILPSCDFLWLRRRDRAMWLIVNGNGRPHPFAEIAGAVCHHYAERIVGRPIAEPYLADLVATLTDGRPA